jgi:hypothetical protein
MSLPVRRQQRVLQYSMEKPRSYLSRLDQMIYLSQTRIGSPREVLKSTKKPALKVTTLVQHLESPSSIEHKDDSNKTLMQQSQAMSTGRIPLNHQFSLSEMATTQCTLRQT